MLRTPEARLYRSLWSDGSIDLVAGLSLVVIGMGYVLNFAFVTAIVAPLALVAWMTLRSRVVEPRTGRAVPRRDRRERARAELVISAIAGATLLAAALGAAWAVRADLLPATEAVDGLPAVLVALLALADSALTLSPRFAWYAVLLVLGGVLTVVLGAGPGLPLVVVGVVAAVTGGVLLARLLADTPRVGEE